MVLKCPKLRVKWYCSVQNVINSDISFIKKDKHTLKVKQLESSKYVSMLVRHSDFD